MVTKPISECKGITKNGERCKLPPLNNSNYCVHHQPKNVFTFLKANWDKLISFLALVVALASLYYSFRMSTEASRANEIASEANSIAEIALTKTPADLRIEDEVSQLLQNEGSKTKVCEHKIILKNYGGSQAELLEGNVNIILKTGGLNINTDIAIPNFADSLENEFTLDQNGNLINLNNFIAFSIKNNKNIKNFPMSIRPDDSLSIIITANLKPNPSITIAVPNIPTVNPNTPSTNPIIITASPNTTYSNQIINFGPITFFYKLELRTSRNLLSTELVKCNL